MSVTFEKFDFTPWDDFAGDDRYARIEREIADINWKTDFRFQLERTTR